MGTTLRRIIWGLLGLLAAGAMLVGGYVYWMFYDNRMPGAGEFVLDISAIRAEAQTLPGPMPVQIEVETLSLTPAPEIAMVAGTNWAPIDLVPNAYLVRYPESFLMIETGQSRENAMQFGARTYDDDAWTRMMKAVASADMIALTHGHPDHAGGLLAAASNAQVQDAAFLNAGQVTSMMTGEPAAEAFTPRFEPDGLLAISPGVVLIPAPGHSPGSQMIYVQLEDGREILFMGDTASLAANVKRLRPRSRYVMTQIGADDRRAVFLQTAALKRLSEAESRLTLVPGHDADVTENLIDAGILVRGFNGE